jgi:hypothetical protein
VGIGSRTTVKSVSVRWPSGKTSSTQAVPEGTLLTAYENPTDSPSGQAFTRDPYRVTRTPPPPRTTVRPSFLVRTLDATAKPARLRVYTAFTTSSPSTASDVPVLRRLKEQLNSEGVDLIAVPIDETDDNSKLAAYAQQWKPTARLVNLAPAKRAEAVAAYTKALGQVPPLPSTVITDDSGQILSAHPGLPTLSALRQMLPTSGW